MASKGRLAQLTNYLMGGGGPGVAGGVATAKDLANANKLPNPLGEGGPGLPGVQPSGPIQSIDRLPGVTNNPPVTLPPWPLDPVTGQPTIGPIPTMPPGISTIGGTPTAPAPPVQPAAPYHLPAGSSSGADVGLGAMANDYGKWLSDPANASIIAQFAGNARGLQQYWMQNVVNPTIAAATNMTNGGLGQHVQPFYPFRGSGARDAGGAHATYGPAAVGPQAQPGGTYNPYARWGIGTNTQPVVGPPKNTTTTPPPFPIGNPDPKNGYPNPPTYKEIGIPQPPPVSMPGWNTPGNPRPDDFETRGPVGPYTGTNTTTNQPKRASYVSIVNNHPNDVRNPVPRRRQRLMNYIMQ